MPNRLPRPAPAQVRNRLLRSLPPDQFERLLPRLTATELPLHTKLLTRDEAVDRVHFVENGTVSMISTLQDGGRIEVGMAGSEGMVGLPLLLGSGTSAVEALVQLRGSSLNMSAAAFRTALADLPALLPLLLRYVDAFYYQVTQTAACNGRHPIEQRLARWLLMGQDRAGTDDYLITQEFLSTMLGVTRPGVTLAMGALARAGLVLHARGRIAVLDRPGLKAAACQCYAAVQRRFAWLEAAGMPGS